MREQHAASAGALGTAHRTISELEAALQLQQVIAVIQSVPLLLIFSGRWFEAFAWRLDRCGSGTDRSLHPLPSLLLHPSTHFPLFHSPCSTPSLSSHWVAHL